MLYTTLKYLHILLAIIAVGFNASYGILLARAAREPQHEGHVLRTVKVLDDRFANPAYVLLLVTGLSMVLVGDIPITTLWIVIALSLYAVLVVLGAVLYSPTLRRQIQVLDAEGPGSPAYRRLATRGRIVGIVLAFLVLAIISMMVFKPTL